MEERKQRLRGHRKVREGTVVSHSGNKTIVVEVETRRRHPRYEKVVTFYRKFHTHDEQNQAKVGDRVRIVETRPLSRLKRWRLLTVLACGRASEPVESETVAPPERPEVTGA